MDEKGHLSCKIINENLILKRNMLEYSKKAEGKHGPNFGIVSFKRT